MIAPIRCAPAHVPLVVSTRGQTIENIHYGSIAVVDTRGRVLHAAGDPGFITFTRSALKAFQALPFFMDDGPRALGLSMAQRALMTASHSGEDFHVHSVDGLLERARASVVDLQCGCHVPYHFEARGLAPEPGQSFDARHHNCSGKHAGFLAYCHLHGLSRQDYLDPGHPLQARIRHQVGAVLDRSPESIALGTDGCSAPNLALPLSDLARLWAMLATAGEGLPALDRRPDIARALGEMFEAMTTHPEQVSGTERTDLHLAQAGAGDWVAKAGADGVQTLAIRSRGLGIALKISDGHADARHIALVEVLRQLGLVQAEHPALDRYRRMVIRNIAGREVGERVPVFELSGIHS
jgi:L-asparaginase II